MDKNTLMQIIVPLVFILWWCFMISIIGHFSGWRRLSAKLGDMPIGQKISNFTFQQVSFGILGYNGCVNIEVYSNGIRLSLWPLFKIAHPPFFIPFTVMENIKHEKKYGMDYLYFNIMDPVAKFPQIRLSEKTAKKLQEILQPPSNTLKN